MPAMPRVNDKYRKIAYKILGKPDNMRKATVYAETSQDRDKSGVDELMDIKRVIPQNYF
jgi:hypothetical protein